MLIQIDKDRDSVLPSEAKQYEIGDHRRTPSTRYLNSVTRRKVIMSRQDASQFLDPEQNAQVLLDADLFLDWQEMAKRREEQRISECCP